MSGQSFNGNGQGRRLFIVDYNAMIRRGVAVAWIKLLYWFIWMSILRESKDLIKIEKKWLGQRVKYYLFDVLDRASHGRKLEGPFMGVVSGVTTNGAAVEDRLEGKTHRNSVQFTGCLIVQRDSSTREDFPWLEHVELIKI